MRFAMTARTIARQRGEGEEMNEMTQRNVEKVTRFRPAGEADLEQMVEQLSTLGVGKRKNPVSSKRT
jgi:large subunit ribosomal protein L17